MPAGNQAPALRAFDFTWHGNDKIESCVSSGRCATHIWILEFIQIPFRRDFSSLPGCGCPSGRRRSARAKCRSHSVSPWHRGACPHHRRCSCIPSPTGSRKHPVPAVVAVLPLLFRFVRGVRLAAVRVLLPGFLGGFPYKVPPVVVDVAHDTGTACSIPRRRRMQRHSAELSI